MKNSIVIPATVPTKQEKEFTENYQAITKQTDNLFIFAADHKLEHLNKDFHGEGIPKEVNNPKRLFQIADQANVGAFATHLGLIARYGKQYPNINYIVKLNGKTDVIPKNKKDPLSELMWTVEDVARLKIESKLSIRGIGFTIFLGSKHEADMLTQAAQAVLYAHYYGLVATLWIYPRGEHVAHERDNNIIAGAAGVANSLGADFVKINSPEGKNCPSNATRAELMQQAVAAAGNTKVVISGGKSVDSKLFLQKLRSLMTIGGVAGAAIGRNIYQRSMPEALKIAQSISDIIYKQ